MLNVDWNGWDPALPPALLKQNAGRNEQIPKFIHSVLHGGKGVKRNHTDVCSEAGVNVQIQVIQL